jgi:hypothetical protein
VQPPAVMTGRSEWTQQSSTALNAVVLVSNDFLSPAPSIPRGLARLWLHNIMKTSATNHFSSTKHTALFTKRQRTCVENVVGPDSCALRSELWQVLLRAMPVKWDGSFLLLFLLLHFFPHFRFLFLSSFPTLSSLLLFYFHSRTISRFSFVILLTSVLFCLNSRGRERTRLLRGKARKKEATRNT